MLKLNMQQPATRGMSRPHMCTAHQWSTAHPRSPSAKQCPCALPPGCRPHSPRRRSAAGSPGTRRLRVRRRGAWAGAMLGSRSATLLRARLPQSKALSRGLGICGDRRLWRQTSLGHSGCSLVMEAPSTMKAAVWRGKRFFCGWGRVGQMVGCRECPHALPHFQRRQEAFAGLGGKHGNTRGGRRQASPVICPCPAGCPLAFWSTKPGMNWDK